MENLTVEFEIHSENQEVGIAHLSGAVDLSNVEEFSKFLEKVIDSQCPTIVFDLAGLGYMNSTGFGALSAKTISENHDRRFIFCNMEENITSVFAIFGLESICEVYTDLPTALAKALDPDVDIEQCEVKISESATDAAEEIPAAEAKAEFPLVKACPSCSKKVNFHRAGHYKCPHCGVIHYVNEEGHLSIITKPLKASLPAVPKNKHDEKSDVVEILLLSDPKHLEKIRDFIVSFAKDHFTKEESGNIAMAVDEACANAMEHAHKLQRNKKIYMCLIINERYFSIKIADSGNNTFREDMLKKEQGNFKETGRGMGLPLMRRMMDEVSVERSPTGGTAITLTKFLTPKNPS